MRTTIAQVLFALALTTVPAVADAVEFRQWGIQGGGGYNFESHIEYYAIQPYVGFTLWDRADRWFTGHGVEARWIVEPWAAWVRDRFGKHQTESFEIGVSPLFARLSFGDGRLRPFLEGGEGILYTDLRKQSFSTRVQFSSQIGAGLGYALDENHELTFAVRFRHISNAGIESPDPGVNTLYGLLGLTFR